MSRSSSSGRRPPNRLFGVTKKTFCIHSSCSARARRLCSRPATVPCWSNCQAGKTCPRRRNVKPSNCREDLRLLTAWGLIPKYSATCSVLNTPPFCSINWARASRPSRKALASGSEACICSRTSGLPIARNIACQLSGAAAASTNDASDKSMSCRMNVPAFSAHSRLPGGSSWRRWHSRRIHSGHSRGASGADRRGGAGRGLAVLRFSAIPDRIVETSSTVTTWKTLETWETMRTVFAPATRTGQMLLLPPSANGQEPDLYSRT